MPRMNLSNTKPLCLNTVRQATRANKTTKQCRCALTQWGGKKLDQSARKEVLCLNTELQPLAARSSNNPTPKRRAENEKGRGSKCCALTQSQLPQRRKQDRENQSPEGKRGRKKRNGHGEAGTSNTLTAPPCKCNIWAQPRYAWAKSGQEHPRASSTQWKKVTKKMKHSDLFPEKIIQRERTTIPTNKQTESNTTVRSYKRKPSAKSPRPQVSLFLPQCQLILGHLWEEAALIVAE